MTNTDTLRKIKAKLDNFFQNTLGGFVFGLMCLKEETLSLFKKDKIGEFEVVRWRRYVPSFDYNSRLNCLSINFYDCSMLTRHLTKTHLIDYQVNMYPKWKWLSWCGVTIWFPYTWDEIKTITKNYLIGDDIKEFEEINNRLSKEIDLLKSEATDLVYHAEASAKFLRDNGFHANADKLESRYIKLGKRLGIYSKKKKPTPKTKPIEEEKTP